ncbi:hypothetical protein C8J56DRAFT_935237 [Mycena floridula]|nr:hypothetical protein C8J56DRAFT_935237 [Mycena floridula]
MSCLNSLSRKKYLVILLLVFGILYLSYQLRTRARDFWATRISDIGANRPVLTEYNILPETKIPHGAYSPGFTMLDNLYLLNGSLSIRTSEPWLFNRDDMLSRPLAMGQGYDLKPTDQQLEVLDISNFSNDTLPQPQPISRIEGFTIILYDPPQFVAHLYHFIGEIVLGAWRIYSKLAEDHPTEPLPLPDRFIFPFMDDTQWKDNAGLNAPLLRAAFPNIKIEADKFWNESTKSNVTILFDRVMLVSREAAHHSPLAGMWNKMIGGTWNITVPDNYFEVIRQNVVRNLVGYVPNLDSNGFVPSGWNSVSAPIVTYISRQRGGRRLREEDHKRLVESLMELERDGICKVVVAPMEKMSLWRQVEISAKSTILVGVHGNGLTHQLWMPPRPRSTVIEIFFPQGYLFDYEMLARNMGHKHYAIWNDTSLTYPQGTFHQGSNIPDGFGGTEIPVFGPTVANLIRQRLMEAAVH